MFDFNETILIVINMGRRKTKIDRGQLYQLYIVEEKSVRDVAKILDASDRTIKNRLKEFDIPARDRIKAVQKGIKKKLKKIIDKDFLYNLYVVQDKSSREVSKICKTSHMVVIQNLRDYNIPIREPSKAFLGKKLSKEHKEKIGDAHRGDKSPHWKGGISGIANNIRRISRYADWRLQCLKRDKYTCQHCGEQPGRLHVDHIKSFAVILDENKILTTQDAVNCQELWKISNGKTLCVPCHRKTETWGYKTTKYLLTQSFII